MVIKHVPFENKQSSQIGILKELAISLVTFLVPASYLAGLITPVLAIKANITRERSPSMAVLPYRNTRKTSTCCTVAETLPSFRTRDISSYHQSLLRTVGPGRSTPEAYPVAVERSIRRPVRLANMNQAVD